MKVCNHHKALAFREEIAKNQNSKFYSHDSITPVLQQRILKLSSTSILLYMLLCIMGLIHFSQYSSKQEITWLSNQYVIILNRQFSCSLPNWRIRLLNTTNIGYIMQPHSMPETSFINNMNQEIHFVETHKKQQNITVTGIVAVIVVLQVPSLPVTVPRGQLCLIAQV